MLGPLASSCDSESQALRFPSLAFRGKVFRVCPLKSWFSSFGSRPPKP